MYHIDPRPSLTAIILWLWQPQTSISLDLQGVSSILYFHKIHIHFLCMYIPQMSVYVAGQEVFLADRVLCPFSSCSWSEEDRDPGRARQSVLCNCVLWSGSRPGQNKALWAESDGYDDDDDDDKIIWLQYDWIMKIMMTMMRMMTKMKTMMMMLLAKIP